MNQTAGAVLVTDAGVSFGGAGFLLFYYLGIVEVLSKLGVITATTKLAGSSSGALITTSHCAGVPSAETYKASLNMAHSCREHMSCTGSLDRELRRVLHVTLPEDAYERCRNKGYIAITTGQLVLNNHHPLLVADFRDQADLIAAAAGSSFIPLWSAASMASHFRGMPVYDGGFASQQPCPPDIKHCIKVSTSNPAWPKRTTVESFMARAAVRGPAVLMKADNKIRHYPPITPTGSHGPDPALIELAAKKGVDIAPGIYNKVSFSQEEWNNWALSPADDGTLHHMYELGKADAAAWAKHKLHPVQHPTSSGGAGRRLAAGA